MSLLTLPQEIIVVILQDLGPQELISCQLVCHKLKAAIDDNSALLHYGLLLSRRGMSHGPKSSLSIAERLQRLRAHQDYASRPHDWIEHATVTELYQHQRLEMASGSLLMFSDSELRCLILHQLAQPLRGIEEQQWTIPLGEHLSAVCMESSQDLVVLVETSLKIDQVLKCLHICSLTTGRQHPSVIFDSKVDLRKYSAIHRSTAIVDGDCLAIQVVPRNTEGAHLCIWNWKTGTLEMQILMPQGRASLAVNFLDDTRIIVADGSHNGSSSLLVYQFRHAGRPPDSETLQQHPICSLMLIRLSAVYGTLELVPCRTLSGLHRRGHFYRKPSTRLFYLVFDNGALHRTHALLFSSDTLLFKINVLDITTAGATVEFPWNEWRLDTTVLTPRAERPPPPHPFSAVQSHGTCALTVRKPGESLSLWRYTPGRAVGPQSDQGPSNPSFRVIPLPQDSDFGQVLGRLLCEDTLLIFEIRRTDDSQVDAVRVWAYNV